MNYICPVCRTAYSNIQCCDVCKFDSPPHFFLSEADAKSCFNTKIKTQRQQWSSAKESAYQIEQRKKLAQNPLNFTIKPFQRLMFNNQFRPHSNQSSVKTAINVGDELPAQFERKYKVIRYITYEDIGEIYEIEDVSIGGKYALKLYFEDSLEPYNIKLIERLISRGQPDNCFLWPLEIITYKNLIGYVMHLRPEEYKSILSMLRREIEPTFTTLCDAAINLATGFLALHSQGLCHRNITYRNIYMNPMNGDVLIGANDTVTVNKDSDGYRLVNMRFIAPEIKSNNVHPSVSTDLYSISVLLFYMFMIHHPLEGKIISDLEYLNEKITEKIYSIDPIFIWDPCNTRNRPISGYADNAIIFWDIYPQYFRNLFIQAFTSGLKNPDSRIVERQWIDALCRLKGSIKICSDCGVEIFYDPQKSQNHCWQCKNIVTLKANKKRP